MRSRLAVVVGPFFLFLMACSSSAALDAAGDDAGNVTEGGAGPSPDGGGDGGPDNDGSSTVTVDGGLAVAPRVIDRGGPVMSAVSVVPVFFSGDSDQSSVEQFLSALSGSSYWAAVTAEYGVGALSRSASVVTSDGPPTTADALASWLAQKSAAGEDGWPKADATKVYAVFMPAGAAYSGDGIDPQSRACTDYLGYHLATTASDGTPVVYAVILRCPDYPGLGWTTASLSHELVEAATDPYYATKPAYQVPDDAQFAWDLVPGGELADMCEWGSFSYASVGGFTVQRSWSNRAAAAGHDPCLPALAGPYYTAIPMFTETVPIIDSYVGTFMGAGMKLAVGESKTIAVDLYSDAPTTAWTVQANDAASDSGNPPELDLAWDRTTGNAADELHLTITRLRAGAAATGGSSFRVYSYHDEKKGFNLWPGFVAN